MTEKRYSRNRRREAAELTEEVIYLLEHGHDIFAPMPSDAELRRLWRLYQAAGLLDKFIAEHPGSRPWCWWRWESKEPRRLLSGDCRPLPGAGLFRGIPAKFKTSAVLCDDPTFPRFETERDYLTRLHLLTPGERRQLSTTIS